MDTRDPRTLRLWDLASDEAVVIRCACGRSVHFGQGFLQRHHRIPSDTLLYDLQYRFRCSHCGAKEGFVVSVERQVWKANGAPDDSIVVADDHRHTSGET